MTGLTDKERADLDCAIYDGAEAVDPDERADVLNAVQVVVEQIKADADRDARAEVLAKVTPEFLAEHRRNEVDEPGGGHVPLFWRVRCDGRSCDFYAERKTWFEACAAHEEHLIAALVADLGGASEPQPDLRGSARAFVDATTALHDHQERCADEECEGDCPNAARIAEEWLAARRALLAAIGDCRCIGQERYCADCPAAMADLGGAS